MLAAHFVKKYAAANGVPERPLSAEAQRRLTLHRWPGNVRELENAIRRALIMGGEVLAAEDFDQITGSAGTTEGATVPGAAGAPALPFPVSLDDACRVLANATVELYGGNKSRAAAALGISRKTLYTLLADAEVGA